MKDIVYTLSLLWCCQQNLSSTMTLKTRNSATFVEKEARPMATCPKCRYYFQVLEDEDDGQHGCPSCGYGEYDDEDYKEALDVDRIHEDEEE